LYDLYRGDAYDNSAKMAYFMLLFGQVRVRRVTFEAQWEEAAALCWPEYRNSFSFGHNRPAGMKYTEFQVDSTGSIASHRFMAICDALLTPWNMMWSQIRASNHDLMKDRDAKIYFHDLTKCLWAHRYATEANFMGQQQQNWQALGVFGNQGMLIDELDKRPGNFAPGLRYMSQSPGEIYVLQNHQGRVDGFIRHFRWTARQAYQCWPGKIPEVLTAALEKNSQQLYDFLQFVMPRTDYEPHKIFAPQGKPWSSTYVSITGYCILEESGYRTFPLAFGRYQQAPEEEYGRGPAQMVLPELKTLNAEKAVFLKQGHRAADPAYLIGDDGLMDFKNHPGSFNYGGFNEDGRMMVGILPTGEIQVSEKMLEASTNIINDAFLTTLFPLLFDTKGGQQKSAREVIEAANEKGIFLAPTLGRQYGEYLGALIDRELDVLSSMGCLPKMPQSVREAKGEYQIIYTSPLAKALEGQAAAGFMRTAQMIGEMIQTGADPALVDILDFDEAVPHIADIQHVPPRWIADPKKVAAKAKQRAQAAERENQVKELPGKAAIMKAQAITAKAQNGGNTGGTLSGTPQGGMPMMPGQAQPGGRGFGQPG
jgi:hypothetical protein